MQAAELLPSVALPPLSKLVMVPKVHCMMNSLLGELIALGSF
jgi:hypothetical protein